jgi:hypothetical protein
VELEALILDLLGERIGRAADCQVELAVHLDGEDGDLRFVGVLEDGLIDLDVYSTSARSFSSFSETWRMASRTMTACLYV